MRSFVGRVAESSSLWLLAAGFSVAVGMVAVQPAFAVETQVNVAIDGSTAPDLGLEGSTSIVSSMPIILTGRASNLTQVRVFVDGVYTATVPLTPADTSFTYSLWVSEGTHVVKFIGISAYTSENVEQVVTVEYIPVPNGTPTGGTNGSQSPGSIQSGSNPNTNGIIIGGSTQPENTTATPPRGSQGNLPVPQWIVQLLVPLDLVNPARVDETPHTLSRFLLFTLGISLLLFAWPALLLYRRVRYGLRGRLKRPLPLFLRKNPLFWLRIAGGVLLAAAFFWV